MWQSVFLCYTKNAPNLPVPHTYCKAVVSELVIGMCDIVGLVLLICQCYKVCATHVRKFLGNYSCSIFRSTNNWSQTREGIYQHRMSKIPQKNNSGRGEVYSFSLLLKFLGGQCQISCQQALAYCCLLTDRSTAERCSVECQTFVSYAEKSLLIFLPLLCSQSSLDGGLSATCAYSA